MMMLLSSYVRTWRRILYRRFVRPGLREPAILAGFLLLGFCGSAASLGGRLQPFALGFLCAGLPGWSPMFFALGSSLGYWFYWGKAGLQGILWICLGLPVCLVASRKRLRRLLLPPALSGLVVAAVGVIFQLWQRQDPPILLYLLQICLACGSCWLFSQVKARRDSAADWIALSLLVLALAQVAPLPFLCLGFTAAAMLVNAMPFPAVALAGLALDLAQVTPVPMTAVLALSYLLRLLPGAGLRILNWLHPALVYIVVMALCGKWDLYPLPALILGGFGSLLLPKPRHLQPRRGETGIAQVRLEIAAGVLAQTEQLLLEVQSYPIDERALVEKATYRACGSCPCRKSCKQREKEFPTALLHENFDAELPLECKKQPRLIGELRRAQEELRLLQADRQRQQEYRGAVVQQYRFLSEYLQELADKLPQRGGGSRQRFQPEVAVCSAGKEIANGDRCLWFAGTDCRYYLLLCDGMGTGLGAAQEAKSAGAMLRRLLMAGFPAPYALRSLNSLCTLRGRAGAVTVDLAEIHLESGWVTLYKWGAAPSYLLVSTGPERIGRAGPPPGLSIEGSGETIDRLSLRRNETLVLLSDGVDPKTTLAELDDVVLEPPGTIAARFLEKSRCADDDATAAVVRLCPIA